MASQKDLLDAITKLKSPQLDILVEAAKALSRPITAHLLPSSDIMQDGFAESFSNRLCFYHVTHFEKLSKRAFEFSFVSASKSAGRNAKLTENQTHPGADAVVDGIAYSLKTEAAKGILRDRITISKLMEARWIRECRSEHDFSEGVRDHILKHLRQYSRIIILRGFDLPNNFVEYQFVEIHRDLLLSIEQLNPGDFTPRTRNGGTHAAVLSGGSRAFTLVLDGSVEKVTISGLRTELCKIHGSWKVPVFSI